MKNVMIVFLLILFCVGGGAFNVWFIQRDLKAERAQLRTENQELKAQNVVFEQDPDYKALQAELARLQAENQEQVRKNVALEEDYQSVSELLQEAIVLAQEQQGYLEEYAEAEQALDRLNQLQEGLEQLNQEIQSFPGFVLSADSDGNLAVESTAGAVETVE